MAAARSGRKAAGRGGAAGSGGAAAEGGSESDSSSVLSIDEADYGEAGARRRTGGRGVPGTKAEAVDVVHWRPPYPSRPWRSRPEAILVQAGANAESRRRAALGQAELLRELVIQFGRQSPHVGEFPVAGGSRQQLLHLTTQLSSSLLQYGHAFVASNSLSVNVR